MDGQKQSGGGCFSLKKKKDSRRRGASFFLFLLVCVFSRKLSYYQTSSFMNFKLAHINILSFLQFFFFSLVFIAPVHAKNFKQNVEKSLEEKGTAERKQNYSKDLKKLQCCETPSFSAPCFIIDLFLNNPNLAFSSISSAILISKRINFLFLLALILPKQKWQNRATYWFYYIWSFISIN